ncbi:hypothetical protein [uncultured Sphaerochaeta sp.]|uniref:hypothetical protein n=1 Tax=uncultured Sphaerochaeta sp. TaxID=886478 RepID=UPI003747ED53
MVVRACICITGSGGKTTALIQLANAYAAEMKRVLVLYHYEGTLPCRQGLSLRPILLG